MRKRYGNEDGTLVIQGDTMTLKPAKIADPGIFEIVTEAMQEVAISPSVLFQFIVVAICRCVRAENRKLFRQVRKVTISSAGWTEKYMELVRAAKGLTEPGTIDQWKEDIILDMREGGLNLATALAKRFQQVIVHIATE